MGKHKRIKSIDPFFSGPRKEKLIREKKAWERKQDNAPEDPDEQAPPGSYRMMLERVEWMKKSREERRDANAELILKAQGLHEDDVKKDNNVKSQRKNESSKEYLRRVAEGANAKIKDHRVKLMMDDSRDPVERPRKRKAWNKHQRSLVVLQKKKAHKKVEEDLDRLEKEFFEDKIAFGDVVQHPPQLTSKPRGVKKMSSEKSGGRKLLLNSLFSGGGTTSNPGQGPTRIKKRKAMTLHERRLFDEKQSAAVDAYRKMKQEKMLQRAKRNGIAT